MLKEEIHLWDLERILFGEVPFVFFIELLIRLAVVYLLLLTAMRLMGKRMASQLSGIELAAMVSLAAAIGMAIANPDKGLLPAIIISAIVVVIQQIVVNISIRNQTFEQRALGDINILVDESTLRLDEMEKSRISKERVFAQLRSGGIKHLGEVKRLYFETSGQFTIVKQPDSIAGLSVVPARDRQLRDELGRRTDGQVCGTCGKKKPGDNSPGKCDKCGSTEFEPAIL